MKPIVHSMDHLFEVLKIVEGAVNADPKKVASYAELLASKLAAEGDERAAKRLRGVLEGGRTTRMELSETKVAPRVPVDSESRLELGDERRYRPEDVKLVLEPDTSSAVEEFLRNVRAADKLLAHGIDMSPSLIAYGPPGCGKTELAKYVSAELALPLITARTDSLISSFLGSTAKNLRLLFEHAMGRPCVLFLDEFDAVAKLRDDRHELGELKRVVVSLLQNIDALDGRTVIIAATNHEHLLDPAIWRRFAYRIRISKPSLAPRAAIFRLFLAEFSREGDADLFAAVSDGMTGAEIREVAEAVKRDTILAGRDSAPATDVLRRLLHFQVSRDLPVGETPDLAAELRRVRTAYPKVLTYRLLADIYGISTGHVSNLLREKE